ncbi:hypothetical protein ZIOFF_064810 [Zingiber officinale]|uniref:K Homology domain-containing protein n=1 Tax=Zingiber officinale TaxID=94328 RepID=A0A8J5EWI1_ZINOF|nr:hypothetical protein ZIOFF_064810 [Zingiber officinale]
MDSGRYMAYSPSPSTAPHSPHISVMRTAGGALGEQEKLFSSVSELRGGVNLASIGNLFSVSRDSLESLPFNFLRHKDVAYLTNILVKVLRRALFARYLAELFAEQQKLNPFVQVLPHSYHLLSQVLVLEIECGAEILRVTTLLENASLLDQSGFEHGSPLITGGLFPNGGVADMNSWASAFQSEKEFFSVDLRIYLCLVLIVLQRLGALQPSTRSGWVGQQGSSSGLIVKKTIRVDIPVDQYPNYNFVGRLLGPRGNSLKRLEALTACRVLIRGRGSIKDPVREEMMRGKPGYEHLNEPLHILVEADLPVEIVDTRLMQTREALEEMLKPVSVVVLEKGDVLIAMWGCERVPRLAVVCMPFELENT